MTDARQGRRTFDPNTMPVTFRNQSGVELHGETRIERSVQGEIVRPADAAEAAHFNSIQNVCGSCVAEGALVFIDGAVARIEDADRATRTLDPQGWAPLGGWVATGEKEIVEVRTTRGSVVRVTPDHRLWTERGWVAAADLRTPHYAPSRAYTTGEELATLDAPTLAYGPRVLDVDDALLLGALVGDGWREPNGLGFVFSDQDADAWKPMLAYASERFESREKSHAQRTSKTARVLWRTNASRAFRDVWLSTKDHVPTALWRQPVEVIGAYLRGLFSTDGSITTRPSTAGGIRVGAAFTQVRKSLIDEVRLLLRVLGITSTLSIDHRSDGRARNYGVFQPKAPRNLYQVHVSTAAGLRRFIELVGFVEPRKQVRLEEALKYAGRDLPERVKSVTPVGRARVFDFTVPRSESFYADGVLVHNCSKFNQSEAAIAEIRSQKFYQRLVREDGWKLKHLGSDPSTHGLCDETSGDDTKLTGAFHKACEHYRESRGLVRIGQKAR